MKVLVVGDFLWPWYQEACSRALESLGHTVHRFGWSERFRRRVPGKVEPIARSFWLRLQLRTQVGPAIWRLRRDLIEKTRDVQPDIVFFYNVHLIDLGTVRELKRVARGAVLCQYANDNPFSTLASPALWRNFRRSLPEFHLHFAYRPGNLSEFREAGARRVTLLRSYFVPDDDRPVGDGELNPMFRCDVVFAGHYENDGRVEALERIVRNGFTLRLFGGGWEQALSRLAVDSPLRSLFPIAPVTGAAYRQAICGAKVALCFLSEINKDSYTRRNFQIPAMRKAMLSQRTTDLVGLFSPERETCFFEGPDELIAKLRWLLADDVRRNGIAAAGYARVWRDAHHVAGRMQQFMAAASPPLAAV